MLKDLVPVSNSTLLSDIITTTVETTQGDQTTTITSVPRQSGGSVSIVKTQNSIFSGPVFSSDPFAETDPFDNTDPFSDTFKEDPFVNALQEMPKTNLQRNDSKNKSRDEKSVEKSDSVKVTFNGPLQVTLPPEPAPKSPRMQRQARNVSTTSLILLFNPLRILEFSLFHFTPFLILRPWILFHIDPLGI